MNILCDHHLLMIGSTLYVELPCCMYFRRRVFILGPSHHVRLSGCALSEMEFYETPLYDLTIDTGS